MIAGGPLPLSSTVEGGPTFHTTPASTVNVTSRVYTLQKEEEEAAKVYEEFVESFAGTDEERSSVKTFVRGGTVQPGQRSHEAAGELR